MDDAEALAEVMAQAIKIATAPLLARIIVLERETSIRPDRGDIGPKGDRGESGRDADPSVLEGIRRELDAVKSMVTDRRDLDVDVLATKAAALVPHARDGRDAAPIDVEALALKAAALIPRPRDGKDAEPVDVQAIAEKAAALVPRPADGKDAAQVDLDVVARKAAALIPAPVNGKDAPPVDLAVVALKAAALIPRPDNGKDAEPVDLEALALKAALLIQAPKDGKDAPEIDIDLVARKAAALVPRPKDGTDAPPIDLDVVALKAAALVPRAVDGKDAPAVDLDVVALKAAALVTVTPGVNGKDGADGVTLEELAPVIESTVEKALAARPAPRDGVSIVDALVNQEGRLVITLSDGVTKNVGRVQAEPVDMRVVGDLVKSELNTWPRPANGKDGQNGKDGADGLGFDDLELVVDEVRKMAVLRFTKGERVREFPFPTPLDCGVYSDEQVYHKGNVVTRGGSLWMSLVDGQKGVRPDDKTTDGARGWRLCVQRGREGKQGPAGRPGSSNG